MKQIRNFFHHFFVPHHKNNFKAKAIQLHSLTIYLTLAVIAASVVNFVNPSADILGYSTDITINKLHELTNQERTKNGLEPLKLNPQLSAAAKQKAHDMFEDDYWAHFAPDGTTPWFFILETDYKYEFAGENLAKNFMFSEGVVKAWMDSPTHRDNILKGDYSEIGFAVVDGVLEGQETTLVVQMFAHPLPGYGFLAENYEEVQARFIAEQPSANSAVENTRPESIVVEQPEVQPAQQNVLSNQPEQSVSWQRVLFNSNIIFIAFLIAAFAVDLFVAVKMDLIHVRFGEKHIIHMLFLGYIVIGLYMVTQGVIT